MLRLLGIAAIFLAPFVALRPFEIFITYSDILFMLCYVLLLLTRRLYIPVINRYYWNLFNIGVCLFFLGFILSLIYGDPVRFVIVAAQYLFALYILPSVLYSFIRENILSLDTILKQYVRAIFFICFVGLIVYYFFFEYGLATGLISGQRRSGSFLVNPNMFGGAIVTAFPLATYLRNRRQISLPFFILCILSFMGGLAIASSFGSLIALFIYLCFVLFYNFSIKRFITYMVGGAVAIALYISVLGIPQILYDRVISKLDTSSSIDDLGSGRLRLMIINEAWDRFVNNPLVGVGLDNYVNFSSYKATVHNAYVLFLVEGGVISLLGFLIIFAAPLRLLWIYRKQIPPGIQVLALGVVVSLFINFQSLTHVYARFWYIPLFAAAYLLNYHRYGKAA